MPFRSRSGEIFDFGRHAASLRRDGVARFLQISLNDIFLTTFFVAVVCAGYRSQVALASFLVPVVISVALAWLAATRSLSPETAWGFLALAWVFGALQIHSEVERSFFDATSSQTQPRPPWNENLRYDFWPLVAQVIAFELLISVPATVAAICYGCTRLRDFLSALLSVLASLSSVSLLFGYMFYIFTLRFD